MSSDPDHVEILRRGPTAWNAWREKNPSTVPDLAGITLQLSERQMGPINGGPINLKSARLQGADLHFATLSAADLEAADMSGADFVHARFNHANLRAANLSSALLDHADFAGANLAKVNLCGASLRFAILSTADLEAADMSGADLEHARFDQANLSAANLSNALLDHADFASANLAKVNLCGASLCHARNLTQAQLEESIGSDSTILPPHLRGSVSWSGARSQAETTALERCDLGARALERRGLGARARHTADVGVPHISSDNRPVWIAGVLLIGGALVITGFVWQHEAVVPTSVAQRGSEPSLTEPKFSLDTGEQRLQPSAPEAVTEETSAAERQPSADAEIPPMPSAVSTVDRTESTPEQRPTPVTDGATVPHETNAHTELQASDGAKWSAESFSADAPAARRHGTVPALPTKASIPEPPLTPATEAPAAPLALSTPTASSLSDTVPPPVATAALPSSIEQTNAGSPPMPVRKPVIQKGVSNPGGAETSPKPVMKSVAQTDRSRRAKGQSFVDEKAERKPGSGSIVDLLAGGL